MRSNTKYKSVSKTLILAGIVSLALSGLHVVMIFVGAPAYDYFRAGPEMVALARAGSYIPAAVTSMVVVALALFGLYALAGAGLIHFLPKVRAGIGVIGIIYSIRGIVIVLQIPGLFPESEMRDILFSSVALVMGILYLMGWRKLGK